MNFIFDPSLVLYLPLYEMDGSSFMSRDAYGHLCTVTGALWRPSGHYLDGIDDKVSCGDAGCLSVDEGTLEIWFKTKQAPQTSNRYLISIGNAEDNVDLFIGVNEKLYLYRRKGNVGQTNILSDSTVNDDIWHHAVGAWGSSGAWLIIDGAINGTILTGDCSLTIPANPATRIGCSCSEAANSFCSGLYGEVRVYHRPLKPQEIQHNYLATKWRYQ